MSAPRFDPLAFVALFLIFFLGFKVFAQRTQAKAVAEVTISTNTNSQGGQAESTPQTPPADSAATDHTNTQNKPKDDPEVIAPYKDYAVTQGPHGFSYGQMAIDIAAGKGATIHSPITGKVTELYVDQYGNPTLVIENNHYQILMMHGIYNVSVGQKVKQGDPVGKESNLGYTLDMQGNLCAGRNCGYHTHLNIFDKKKGENVNPLDVINK